MQLVDIAGDVVAAQQLTTGSTQPARNPPDLMANETSDHRDGHPPTPRKHTVVRIVLNVGPFSEAYNGFAMYRCRTRPDEANIVVAFLTDETELRPYCADGSSAEMETEGLRVICCGRSIRRLRRALREVAADREASEGTTLFHVHQAGATPFVWLAGLGLGLRKLPTVYTVHNMFRFYSMRNKVISLINFIISTRVAFVSDAGRRSYPTLLRRLRRGTTRTIVNGLDLARIDATLGTETGGETASGGRGSGTGRRAEGRGFRLVNIGKLVPQKNQGFLIELMAHLGIPVELTIIGRGPLLEKLQHRARELGVAERVRFTGLIPREAVYRELHGADLFLSPSLWEGLPIAVLEAMAVGRPVILSDIEPHLEIGRCGSGPWFVPPLAERWKEAITAVLEQSPEERDAIGRKNRELVARHFSIERMQSGYDALYDEVRAVSGGAG